ncbi:MAG: TetR/AcrR family transcriptional regulator [Candidatus Obscuribacterales bacterium]|nr:TetR/AcrR family transcriptional regulator [Candidatus Obscuribacterales bacterium]
MVRTLDETKRTAILTAAKLIFVRDGVANAKMSDIASEAGVAPGTLYLYFENKEALASAIGDDFFARLIRQLVEEMQRIEGPDDIAGLIEWAAKVGEQERVLLATAKERSHAPNSKKEGHQRKVSQVAGALAGLIERGVIRPYGDASVLAEFFLSLLRRIIMARVLFGDETTTELKAGAVTILQHLLFDDVTVAANQLLKRKKLQ